MIPDDVLGNIEQRRVESWHGGTGQGREESGNGCGRQFIRWSGEGLVSAEVVPTRGDVQLRRS
jgi:hypothetical protein